MGSFYQRSVLYQTSDELFGICAWKSYFFRVMYLDVFTVIARCANDFCYMLLLSIASGEQVDEQ